MIVRTILIKPREGATLDDVEGAIIALPKQVSFIQSAVFGTNQSAYSRGYTHYIALSFFDSVGMEKWSESIYHIPIRKSLRENTTFIVFDREIL